MPTLTELPEVQPPQPSTSTSPTPAANASGPNADPVNDGGEVQALDRDAEGQDDEGRASDVGEVVQWSQDELRDSLASATRLKVRGTAHYGHGRWEEALEAYRRGLDELPPRSVTSGDKGKAKALPAGNDEPDSISNVSKTTEASPLSTPFTEIKDLRGILFANVAACLLKLNRWKDAAKACDDALIDKPQFLKAIYRRAMAYESIGSWSALSSALDDYNTLSALPDVTPEIARQAKLAQARLPKAIEVQQQKEKDEVLSKLKDLGNTVLGKFGFSLDNFKMTEQPGGGYSMNFQQ
ncbi:hypothetical protein JCM10212_004779 [Sporobolomyces blumeae]